MNKNDHIMTLAKFLQTILSIGVYYIFMIIWAYFEYDPLLHNLLIRIIVWIGTLLLSHLLITALLKILFNKKLKFFDLFILINELFFSVVFVFLSGYDIDEYDYVVTMTAFVAIAEGISLTNYIKKKRGRPKKAK